MISVPNHNSPGNNLGLNISLNSYMILEKHHLGEKSFKKLLSLFVNSNKHHSRCLLYHSILSTVCQCWPRQWKHSVKERGKSIFEALLMQANSTDACSASDRGWLCTHSWAAGLCCPHRGRGTCPRATLLGSQTLQPGQWQHPQGPQKPTCFEICCVLCPTSPENTSPQFRSGPWASESGGKGMASNHTKTAPAGSDYAH